jgi:CheY-like chemotaxis protein/anti-sigma regulatory factor (Ser/Thr protein kinase)
MSKAHLLLVDDEPFNLEILSEHLTDAGYSVETASDGELAWQRLTEQGERYDAVLLDRMMPGLDGMEVLRRMKLHPKLQTLPVVLQTAVGAADAVREGMEAGAYYYLTKPFERDLLLAITAAAVAQHQARRLVKQAALNPIDGMSLLHEAEFRARDLDDAQKLATLIGRMCPKSERVALGMAELIINGIEHGNLGLGYDEKKALMQTGAWRAEVDRRLRDPAYARLQVRVKVTRLADMLRIEVCDEGAGFDWTRYLDFDPARAFDPNGRGISMAKAMSFASLEYRGNGNTAIATVLLYD